MMTTDKPVVLVVDDDEDTRQLNQLFFELGGFKVEIASTIQEAMELVDKGREITLGLVDYHMDSKLKAPVLFRHIQSRAAHRMRAYAYTGDLTMETYLQAVHAGAHRVFWKTVHKPDVILDHILQDYVLLKGNILDPRTELFNFHGFREAVVVSMKTTRERRDEHHPAVLAMLFIDVDDFKTINDTWGHETGNRAIKHVGQILKKHTRPEDHVCRISGDEFGVCLLDVDPERAEIRSRELQDAVASVPLQTESGEYINITISVGVAVERREEIEEDVYSNFSRLLSQADAAMYKEKERKKAAAADTDTTS